MACQRLGRPDDKQLASQAARWEFLGAYDDTDTRAPKRWASRTALPLARRVIG